MTKTGTRPSATWLILAGAVVSVLAIPARADETPRSLPELVLLSAGSPVGKTPPSGWSDLIVKSISKLESGDLETLPSVAESTATLFRTAILADVRRVSGANTRYVLRRVGLCLCVPVDGVDTVVTPESASDQPFDLGFVERQVLARAQERLEKTRLVARSPTFAVLAAPTDIKVVSAHKHALLTYVLLLDPQSGRLRTVLWAVSADQKRRTPPKSLTLLPKGLVYTCGLDVVAERLLGALPVNWSFAMSALPPGRRIEFPDSLREWSVDPKKIATQSAAFEQAIRAALAGSAE
jgi:hypothetical protein